MKKEFIVEAKNDGKILSMDILKVKMDNEDDLGNVNCEVALSDKLDVKKGDKFRVTIEKIITSDEDVTYNDELMDKLKENSEEV